MVAASNHPQILEKWARSLTVGAKKINEVGQLLRHLKLLKTTT